MFGYVGIISPTEIIAELKTVHDSPSCHISSGGHYVSAGGHGGCVKSGLLVDQSGQWIVIGIGIDASKYVALDETAWAKLLSVHSPDFEKIDGHFVIVKIIENEIHLYTDQLGIRTIYYGHWKSGIVFSTRPDWIARLYGYLDIDYEAIGSYWMVFNQLSTKSQIQGLSRLGPNGYLKIKNGGGGSFN